MPCLLGYERKSKVTLLHYDYEESDLTDFHLLNLDGLE
jgi:hypothetical protein